MIRDTGWTLLGFRVFESDEMPETEIAFGHDGEGLLRVSVANANDIYFDSTCLISGRTLDEHSAEDRAAELEKP